MGEDERFVMSREEVERFVDPRWREPIDKAWNWRHLIGGTISKLECT